jgi:hypothetical protein
MMSTVDILAAAPKLRSPAGTFAGGAMCERDHPLHIT